MPAGFFDPTQRAHRIRTGALGTVQDMSDQQPDQSTPRPDDDTRPFSPAPAGPAGPPSGPSSEPGRPSAGYDAPAWAGPQPAANPYAQPAGQPFGPTTAPAVRPASGPGAPRGRRRFAAAVIAASLLLGGGAGVGGAAAWDAWSGDDPAAVPSAANPARSTSQAVESSDSTASPAADGTVESVAEKVLPSVVKIDVVSAQGSGSGSGIVLSSDGQILTNNHVIASVAEGGGTLTVAFNDGTSTTARVLGTDPLTDTALIQAEDVSGLTPAGIGTSGDLRVGQAVVAIGSPFGLESTVTSGIVSALDRPVDVGSDATNSTTYPAIQTDAAINPGNSGGPLTDMAGNVVGINSSIRTTGTAAGQASGSIGLGFAIPMDEVLPIVEQMANGQTPTHARLGVSVGDVDPQSALDGPSGQSGQPGTSVTGGALVGTVNAGSTAADAGIAEGDVITRVDDQIITGADSLVATVRSYRPGDTVTVTYLRGTETLTAELTLDSDAEPGPS